MIDAQNTLLKSRPALAAPFGYLLAHLVPSTAAKWAIMTQTNAANRLKISCILASNSTNRGANKLRKILLGAPVGQCSGCLTVLPYPKATGGISTTLRWHDQSCPRAKTEEGKAGPYQDRVMMADDDGKYICPADGQSFASPAQLGQHFTNDHHLMEAFLTGF